MGADEDNDKNHPDNAKLEGTADFKGPGANRGCTDICCALLLIACWVATTGVGFVSMGFIESESLKKGEPARLLNGMDYNANICGIDDVVTATGVNIKDLPKAYYLPSGTPVCIAECPKEDDYDSFYCKYKEAKKIMDAEDAEKYALSAAYVSAMSCMPIVKTRDTMGYCIPEAAFEAVTTAAAAALNKKIKAACTTDNESEAHTNDLGVASKRGDTTWWKPFDENSPFNCTAPRLGIEVSPEFLDPAAEDGFFDRIGNDMFTAKESIMGFGLGVAMVLGFLYLFILRIPGVLATMVWGIIMAIFACFAGMGGMMYLTQMNWQAALDCHAMPFNVTIEENGCNPDDTLHTEQEIKGTLYISYFVLGVAAFYILFVCCILRSRIQLAIGIVKEAAKAIAAMPIITVYPVFQVIGVFLFLMPWFAYMTFLASSGDVVADCICPDASAMTSAYDQAAAAYEGEEAPEKECFEGCFMYKTFAYDTNTKYAGLFMLFSWFWTSQFVIAAGQLVVAMSISTWYFTRDKKEVGNGTFIKAAKSAMWYHLGTAAFGSLIIAIIKTIRVIVAYLQNKAKKSGNKLAQAVLCCIQCFMWCVEKCMKFLNKNAYIQTAIFGYSFCKAAKQAFFLILRNILRITAVAMVSQFVLIIGKLFIMIGATILSYIFMAEALDGQLNYLWFPTILVCFTSYFTAEMFNEVFGMAISTILQCFVADEEMFKPEERFAEGDLAQTINKTNAAAAKGKVVHPESDKYEAPKEGGEDLP